MNQYLRHENARTPEQRQLMQQIEADGVCPFCAEYFATYHPKPILKETEHWFFTENISPYEGTRHHFIFVYKPSHISHLKELPQEAFLSLFELVQVVTKEFEIPGGSFFMRFGDSRYTGGSVTHIHAHLLMGDADAPDHQPVRVKLG